MIISGKPVNSSMSSLNEELKKHNDIIVFDFIDDYWNLTSKVLTSMYFIAQNYNTSYILKTDDDMFVNIKNIYNDFNLENTKKSEDIIFGFCYRNKMRMKNESKRYFVSKDNYPERRYPPYCKGTYIIAAITVNRILAANNNISLLKIEDISIGILARKASNITVQHIRHWMGEGFLGSRCPKSYTQHRLTYTEIKTTYDACFNNNEQI